MKYRSACSSNLLPSELALCFRGSEVDSSPIAARHRYNNNKIFTHYPSFCQARSQTEIFFGEQAHYLGEQRKRYSKNGFRPESLVMTKRKQKKVFRTENLRKSVTLFCTFSFHLDLRCSSEIYLEGQLPPAPPWLGACFCSFVWKDFCATYPPFFFTDKPCFFLQKVDWLAPLWLICQSQSLSKS